MTNETKTAGTEDDNAFEIEIVDDTPEEDKGRPRRPEGAEPEVPSDDEVENYSEGVKKRISKLKYEFHEERRRADEATRLRDEAITFAQQQQKQVAEMRKRLEQGDAAIMSQANLRLKSQLEQTQAKMKAAYEAGDTDAFITANAELAGLKAEEHRMSTYRPTPRQEEPSAPQAQAPKPAPKPPEPSEKAKRWAAANEWFGKDEDMTALAYGVHERIVRQGVAPDSEAYYTAIDSAMRQRFPDKFDEPKESTPRRQPSSVVAPGGRSTAPSPRKITLTATQVSLAKKLGLTPEQYAAQLIKEQKHG